MRRLRLLLPRGLLALAFVALPVVWLRIDVPHRHYSHSVSQLAFGNITGAINEAQKAVDSDPDLAIYQLELGLTQGIAVMKGDITSPDLAIASLQRGRGSGPAKLHRLREPGADARRGRPQG